MLFYLSSAYPFRSAGWTLFIRTAQDKTVSCFLIVPVAVAFAVRNPERVSALILHGGYVRGRFKRGTMTDDERDKVEALYPVPEEIDMTIAREKLASMNIKIDKLTAEQKKYLASWSMGT